ncbi:thermonuclease family protein [Limnoraphis robusta]|uniref:thermonuclease family protein n=1 Tax=Limnoraphis robusta TaxID=1118279 RepID=UPI002B1F86D7|nr:thermonuclease family protein [Limnoraphis robusta]MEA5498027.1 thermonuclease family protein [Limnoraphis robusta BA-68 BA1]
MKRLINILPWLIVAALIFKYWVDSQPTTISIQAPLEQVSTTDYTDFLPTYTVVNGSVYDGDTIRVTDGKTEIKIRFACVDAPERSQPGGIEARDELRKILSSDRNQVKVDAITTDRYGRTVAELWNGQGLVQSQLAGAGLVYPYEQYKSDCKNWDAVKRASEFAIANKLGVWANPNAVKPWDYRKK